ncbi:hypothetical protein [Tortoise microvirus 14]|nr:hypothetical protein [Tortoise microvirus 14]
MLKNNSKIKNMKISINMETFTLQDLKILQSILLRYKSTYNRNALKNINKLIVDIINEKYSIPFEPDPLF